MYFDRNIIGKQPEVSRPKGKKPEEGPKEPKEPLKGKKPEGPKEPPKGKRPKSKSPSISGWGLPPNWLNSGSVSVDQENNPLRKQGKRKQDKEDDDPELPQRRSQSHSSVNSFLSSFGPSPFVHEPLPQKLDVYDASYIITVSYTHLTLPTNREV